MQSCSHTRENRAPCRFGLATHRNRVGEYVLRGLPNIEDGLCLVARNVDSSLLQCFYRQRIENARFQPSALGFEVITAHLVKQCRRDLAARTVLHTNKKNLFLHRPNFNRTRTQLKPSVRLSPERHIALGSTTRMVVPLSSSLSASTRPPCNCAMCFTIARPRPVPRTLSGLRALSAR